MVASSSAQQKARQAFVQRMAMQRSIADSEDPTQDQPATQDEAEPTTSPKGNLPTKSNKQPPWLQGKGKSKKGGK